MIFKNIKTAEELATEEKVRQAVIRNAQRQNERQEAVTAALEVVARVTLTPVLAELSDAELDSVASLFPDWVPGLAWTQQQVDATAVINYRGVLLRVLQPHASQADWLPDRTPALYAPYRDPASGPQPWVQPQGAHDAHSIGDRVTHNSRTWESTHDSNVWEPGVFGWREL